MKKKILFDCERLKHTRTGLAEYCDQLGNTLKDLDKDIYLYVPHDKNETFKDQSRIIKQKSYHKVIPPFFRADLLHGSYQLSPYFKRIRAGKKVLTIHDLNFLYENKNDHRVKRYLKLIQDNIDVADHIVTISEYVKSDILKHLDIKDTPIDVIYNGCPLPVLEESVSPNYKPEGKFLFSIGTVLPKKNFHVIPRLMQDGEYTLVIAGKQSQSYVDQIKEEAKKYNVEDKVELIGTISDQEKNWYIANCEAFVFPSIAEGFGIPIIEAMSFGKPVFLSKHTSCPEIGGELAYYFDSFEAEHMKEVFERSMKQYKETNPAEAIKQHAAKFSWKDAAQAYYDIYMNLLNKS